ncbi:MAG TPA: cytochrome P450 [Blastocatellia bacterium]|nr:cytochrome P450 [Blastocatellia bacterium]
MAVALHPPSPKRQPIMGHLMGFRRDPLNFLLDAARDYGDLVHFKFGPQDIFFINHPDTVRDVLVTNNRNFTKSRGLEMAKRFLGEGLLTSEGDFHRRQRRLAQPAFHHKRIQGYADVMARYGARHRGRWQDGQTLDISQEMMGLTLAIVGKTLFDADVEGEARAIGAALTDIMHMFDRITTPFPWLLELLPLPSNFRFARARARLDETIYRIINERRAAGEDRGDLLSMLLLATDTEGDGTGMSDRQLRDEAMTIFLAGHETTANALTWTWFLLSQHPEVEARLHEEIDAVLQGRLPTAEDFPRLRYTEMVLAEAMRLYPPAWAIGRRAIGDYRIGDYTVPARAIILMSPYVMHRNPRYYLEPARFDPERWTTAAREARPKFAYFPFGGGPRVCIGEGFAWMEGVLLMATIAQPWRLRLAPDQTVAPRPMITLRAKNGIRMRLEKRTAGV